jgi:glycosyltransferase involved in cell wall biosynthesis
MRIIFFGDLAQTGFGTVTLDLGPRLLALGHDVRFVSQNAIGPKPPFSETEALAAEIEIHGGAGFYDRISFAEFAVKFAEAETTYEKALESAKETAETHRYDSLPPAFKDRVFQVNSPLAWNGWRPGDTDVLSTASLFDGTAWEDGWTPEAGFLLGDPIAARATIMVDEPTKAAFGSIPMYHYVPIEGVGLPLRWAEIWKIVRPVAMSEFGADQIEAITGERPPVVYHGIDASVFYPVSRTHPLTLEDGTKLTTRGQCRDWLKIPPSAKVLFRADTNMPRKRYASLFRALAPVLASHPEAILAIHARSVNMGGDLNDEISKYHPSIGSRFVNTGFRDRYQDIPRYMLTLLYNAADLYVSVGAEGFGLTIAESLACGTPAVVLDFSSCSELVGLKPRKQHELAPVREGVCGLAVRPSGLVDNEYNYFWAGVDETAFGHAVVRLLDDTATRRFMGARAPQYVAEHFSWDRAAEQFSELFETSVKEAVAA